MALSGIAMQHANDCYSRGVNFSGVTVCSMALMYMPDGTNVHGSRRGKGYGQSTGFKVVKSCSCSCCSLLQTLLRIDINIGFKQLVIAVDSYTAMNPL